MWEAVSDLHLGTKFTRLSNEVVHFRRLAPFLCHMGPGHSVCVISLLLFHQALAISSSSHGYASTQVSSSHQGLASEVFDETLTIRPLADGKLSTNFEFTITLREEGKTNTRNLSQECESQRTCTLGHRYLQDHF